MDDREIGSAVRRALVDQVGRERFDLWFGDRVDFESTDEGVRVLAPDPFTLDRLRHTLRADIQAAVRRATRDSARVEFRLATGKPASNESTTAERPSRSPSSSVESHPGTPMRTSSARTASAIRSASGVATLNSAEGRSETAVAGTGRALRGFATFVVGDSNRVALAAAQQVVARPGVVSPLFLHGPSGCGKSHLLESIVEAARRRGQIRRSVSLSAEQFTSQFLEALQGSGLPSFRRKYRDVDLLIIDDVQFFLGKKATTLELQHTVDSLHRLGKQLVLAADRAPADLTGLGAELTARLSSGVVCPVEAPDWQVRRGVVEQTIQRLALDVPDEVVDLICEQITGDPRYLIGALHRLQAASQAHRVPVTVELATQTLADLFRATRRVVKLCDIERAVCEVFGLDVRSLQSDRKVRAVSQPRMLAMWLARKHTRAALSEIGQYFGRRSHTSVISAQRKIERLLNGRSRIVVDQLDCSLADAVRRVERQLRTGT